MVKVEYKLPAHPDKGDFEKKRLIELIRLGKMSSPENRFQSIVDRVRAQFNVPYCMISYIDECKLMSQASHGFNFREMDADQAICAYAMHEEDMLVVEDTSANDLLKDHPFVKAPPYIRFYAGIPIRSNGIPVGTLCLADVVTRKLSEQGRILLKQYAGDAEQSINGAEVCYKDMNYGDPRVRSQFLVYNKFLGESMGFFKASDTSAIFIRLMPDSQESPPISDKDLLDLSDQLEVIFRGTRFCKGTFGRSNILLVVENSKLNGYGNAYLCRRALENVFNTNGLSGISAVICYLRIKPFEPENIIQVNNIFNRIMTSFDGHPDSRTMLVSLGEKNFDFSMVINCYKQSKETGMDYEAINDFVTGETILEKVKVPYEFHYADHGDMQLTETESALLINYNLFMFRQALERLSTSQYLVSVELSLSCVESESGKRELKKLLTGKKELLSRLVISVSGFSFAFHQAEVYRFITSLKSMGISIGFNTFSTMISHLPEFIVKTVDYGFIYTPIALDLKKYPDDEQRLGYLIREYEGLGITPVIMRGRKDDAGIIASHGVTLFESSLIPS